MSARRWRPGDRGASDFHDLPTDILLDRAALEPLDGDEAEPRTTVARRTTRAPLPAVHAVAPVEPPSLAGRSAAPAPAGTRRPRWIGRVVLALLAAALLGACLGAIAAGPGQPTDAIAASPDRL